MERPGRLATRPPTGEFLWRGIVAAACNAATITGFYPLVPHVGYALIQRLRKQPLPKGQLRIAVAEWAVALGVTALRPAGFLGMPVALRPRRGPRPVVVVHGFAMSRGCFFVLARRLHAAGLGPIVGFEYSTIDKTADAARSLGAYIDALCESTGASKVDLIGHSMGGLVARYYVALGSGRSRVHNLITVGSPHRGTNLSAAGIGEPARELAVDSALVTRLQSTPLPASTHVTAIWSRSDALVPGERYARFPGADQIVFDDLGHLSLLASRRVARAIIERLRRP